MKKMNYFLFPVLIFFIIYSISLLITLIKNKIVLSIIVSAIITLIIYIIILKKQILQIPEGGYLRYTMLCNSCGWEWMSNVTTRDNPPETCPNCHEKAKLEILGWRKVKLLKKGNKDLRNFFK